MVSCMFVVVSTLCLIFSTLPKFQHKDELGIMRRCPSWGCGTISIRFCFFAEEADFFEIAEAVFVGWFTFEYVIRFIAAPQKLRLILWLKILLGLTARIFRFLKAGMNVVDLLGILPYFASLVLSLLTTSTTTGQTKYQDEMRRIAQIFRIMRILRSDYF